MKWIVRFVSLFTLVVVLAISPVLTAVAQDGGPSTCNGLNTSDCQLLKDSSAAMAGVTSFTMPAWNISAELLAGEESASFEASGSGAVAIPAGLVALLSDLPPAMGSTDLGPFISLLERLDAPMVEEILGDLMLHMNIEHAALDTPEESMSGGLNILFDDMGLYLQAQSPTGAEAWFGQTLKLTPTDLAELQAGLAEMQAELQNEDLLSGLEDLSGLEEYQVALAELANRYVTSVRGTDVTVHGQSAAAITTSFDAKALLNDPELAALLVDLLNDPALADADMGDMSGVGQTEVQFLLMTVGLLLQQADVSVTQWIGLSDSYLYGFAVNIAFELELGLFDTGEELESIAASLDFSVEMDNFNAIPADYITPPTDFYGLDGLDDFYMGSPDQVIANLRADQPVTGSFSYEGPSEHIYGLVMPAGDTVEIVLESDDYPYLTVYGPDGFQLTDFDLYYDDTLTFTAQAEGMHLVVVEAYWDLDYTLTVVPAE